MRNSLRILMTLVVVAIAVASWWYVLFRMRYGMFFGDHLTLNYESPDSIRIFLRMFAPASSTFFWSGSWIFLRLTLPEYALCVPFLLLVMGAFI